MSEKRADPKLSGPQQIENRQTIGFVSFGNGVSIIVGDRKIRIQPQGFLPALDGFFAVFAGRIAADPERKAEIVKRLDQFRIELDCLFPFGNGLLRMLETIVTVS